MAIETVVAFVVGTVAVVVAYAVASLLQLAKIKLLIKNRNTID